MSKTVETKVKLSSTRRLLSEFDGVSKEFDVEMKGDNVLLWNVAIQGPEDTPYSGGTFLLQIVLEPTFPFSSPQITFLTKIFHPNVNSKGMVCLGMLTNGWKPTYSVLEAVKSIQYLLEVPDPDNPMVAEIGGLYLRNRTAFDKKATEWTLQYAV